MITTNCLVLGRTEAYARHHAPLPSMVDAFGNGLGYSLVLIVIGALRELFGKGELFGSGVLPLASEGGWFDAASLMLLAPSAFFLLGGLVWAVRTVLSDQAENSRNTCHPPEWSRRNEGPLDPIPVRGLRRQHAADAVSRALHVSGAVETV